jgi:hypothetical protein
MVVSVIVFLYGSLNQLIGLLIVYLISIISLFLIEKRKKLSIWQERVVIYLIVFPILYFFIPLRDIIALFVGSVIAGILILFSERHKVRKEEKEKEMLPKWEGEDKGE